jgi:hypothetical protein
LKDDYKTSETLPNN